MATVRELIATLEAQKRFDAEQRSKDKLMPHHECPREGCTQQVVQSQLACRDHWYLVTPETRTELTRAYRSGNVDWHMEVMIRAIREMNGHDG